MSKIIDENLDIYLSGDNNDIAVLISGEWGSGKTFLINEFIENNKKDYEFIYISLFGLNTIEDIKPKIIFSKITSDIDFSSITKGLFNQKIPFLNMSINDIPIEEYLKHKKDKYVFIFDDLERTNILLKNIFGYISELLHKYNFHVILVANEKEIEQELYLKYKEKIIGKSFQIIPNIDIVYEAFISKFKENNFFMSNKKIILDVFYKSTYLNLRNLNHILINFEVFIKNIEVKYKENKDFIFKLITVYFALSFELKNAKLSNLDFNGEPGTHDEINQKFKEILRKYDLLEYNSLIFSIYTWKSIFSYKINYKELNLTINETSFFEYKEKWISLISYNDLTEEDFYNNLSDVFDKFSTNYYTSPYELLQITILLLSLSKEGLFDKESNEINKFFNKNINRNGFFYLYLKKSELFVPPNKYPITITFEKESESYIAKKKSIINSFDIYKKNLLHEDANSLIMNFKDKDIEEIKNKLDKYYQTPIFMYVDKNSFLNTISLSGLNNIFLLLEKRYENSYNIQDISKELDFWIFIKDNILKNVNMNSKFQEKVFNNIKYNYLEKICNIIKKESNL